MPDDVQKRTPPDLDRDAPAVAVAGNADAGDGLGERLDAMPAGAALLAELQALDLAALPSYELPEVAVQARRIAAHAHALETAAAAALARHPDLRHPDLAAVCRSLPEGSAFVHADIAAADLSARLLVPPGEAKMLIREGRAYADALADTGAALADGRIHPAKARAIVQGAGDEPAHVAAAVEAEVLPRVAGRSVKQVRADVARALNRVDPEGVADRHRTVRAARTVSRPRILQDGMAGLWAVLPAADAVRLDGMLDALARRSRQAGDPRTVDHLTMSLATLLGADDEPGDLAGYGPIDAQQARAMALDLGSTWRRIVTDPLSGTVLDVGRTTYRPPAALAEHVRHRDKYCTAPGCPVPAARCDLDHTIAYDPPPDGAPPRPLGTTCVHNLGPLCRTHHRLKTAGILRVHQPTAGEFVWRTPTGHAFRVRPGTEEPAVHLSGPVRPTASRPPF